MSVHLRQTFSNTSKCAIVVPLLLLFIQLRKMPWHSLKVSPIETAFTIMSKSSLVTRGLFCIAARRFSFNLCCVLKLIIIDSPCLNSRCLVFLL